MICEYFKIANINTELRVSKTGSMNLSNFPEDPCLQVYSKNDLASACRSICDLIETFMPFQCPVLIKSIQSV